MRLILILLLGLCCYGEAIASASLSNALFLGSREGDPASIVKNVSTIHGDYSELEVDLCISGPDPLILSRFYTSRDPLDIATFGAWRFQPQTFFLICPDPKQGSYQTPQGIFEGLDIFIGTPEGSLLKFSGFQNWDNVEIRSEFRIYLEEDESGICNTAKGRPSSWTHPKNHILYYHPQSRSFELQLSSGEKRIYAPCQNMRQFHLKEEILPTGNRIFYEYDNKQRLKQITMKNAGGTKTLSWIAFNYGSSILATASDGTSVEYRLEKDPSGAYLLSQVQKTASPLCTYDYQIEGKRALLARKECSSGPYIDIQYEKDPPYRAQTLSIPTSDGSSQTHFTYEEGVTHVQFPLGQRTLYAYDENSRLTSIEDTLDGTSYRTLKKIWGKRKNQGSLIAEGFEDFSGNTLYYKTFSYDISGNILEETEFGNLTGQNSEPISFNGEEECHTKTFTYTRTKEEDIVSQINKKGNGTLTAYIPGTSIIKRKEIHQNKQAKRRIFYDYNEEGSLTRITVDNGNTRDPNDVDYIRQKRITVITPKADLPNLGVPEVVEERYYDPETRSEKLLKKNINHFDSCGLVIKQEIFDRDGAYAYSIENGYDDVGRLTTYIGPLGNQITYTYDANSNLIQEETQDLIAHYDYDIQNNLTSAEHSGKDIPSQKTTFVYNQTGQQILEIDPLGNETHCSYDCFGRLTQKTTSDGLWTYAYDLFDHPILITDPLNNKTRIQNNIRGQPTHITSNNTHEESFVYSLEGSLCYRVDKTGITTIFDYDYLGRITNLRYYKRGSMKDPFKTNFYTYNAFQLLSESTEKGDIKYSYSAAGDLTEQTIAQPHSKVWRSYGISRIENGDVTNYAYDSFGRLYETKKWKNSSQYTLYTQSYDLLGNITKETIKNEQGKTLYQKGYTYTPSGELFQEVNFPHNVKTISKEYTYDPLHRPSQLKKGENIWNITYQEREKLLTKIIQDPLGSTIENSCNHGQLTSFIHRDSKQTPLLKKNLAYDPLGNLIEEKTAHFNINHDYHPNMLLASTSIAANSSHHLQYNFTYNPFGDLISQAVPSFEKPIEYTYDEQGTLRRITYQESPKASPKEYTLTSDKQGNVTKLTQKSAFTLERTYNTYHQILTETLKDKWGVYTTSFKYNGEGYLTQIILPDSSSIEYIYDGPFVSKILRLSKQGKQLYSYEVTERDLMGNILQEILPGNLGLKTYTYNTQGQTTGIFTDHFSDHITLDPLGNYLTQETTWGKEKVQAQFTYDPLSQLTSEKGPYAHTYSYDLLQNCQSKDDISYTPTPLNQTIQGIDFTCNYDDCGNLKSYSSPTGPQEFQFDSLGRLITAHTLAEGSIQYTYDIDARRLSKVIDEEELERYFYLGNYELGALDEHGEMKALRIPINPNALENTSILSIELENTPYIPLADLRKNIRCLIEPQRRTIVESYHFSAFGEEEIVTPRRKVTQSVVNNPWRFQGKRHDIETGLIYYSARYYHPKLQKWISPDPLGSGDSLNLYLFCHNNPLKYHDPWGLTAQCDENCGCVIYDYYPDGTPNCILCLSKCGCLERLRMRSQGLQKIQLTQKFQGLYMGLRILS